MLFDEQRVSDLIIEILNATFSMNIPIRFVYLFDICSCVTRVLHYVSVTLQVFENLRSNSYMYMCALYFSLLIFLMYKKNENDPKR